MEGVGDRDGHVLGGRYRLGDKLGQGGMGAVYTAMQTSLGRKVAVKVLLPQLANDAALIARFRGEAEQAGRLNHPHIVQVLDFGQEDDGSVWIAMEMLEGEALADRMERGPMSEADVVRFAKETLAGLEAAHGARLVHRDLKPDNIFMQKSAGVGDMVKILDFGIAKLLDGDSAAKLTATGLIIGTPLYMSPEQARGDDLDPRSDLYSLSAVMYEALTGVPPFTGRNYNALLVAVLTDTPKPIELLRPDITPALADVVMRALDKTAAGRFASAAEMGSALSTFTPKTETPPSPAELGLASTMATPQVGSIEPAKPLAPDTPVAGGVGPPVTREGEPAAVAQPAAQVAAQASAVTAPMTDVAPVSARPVRRHGWLVAMVAVALLAGIGGTATFMSSVSEPDPVATAVVPALVTPVTNPGLGVTPTPPTQPPMNPTTGGLAPVAAVAPAGGEGEDGQEPATGEDTAPAGHTKTSYMRRPPRVTITAGITIMGEHRGWREGNDFVSHYNWSSCWPRSMPFPPNNWGINIEADTTAEGAMSGFRVTGNDNYPVVSRCLMEHLRGTSVGPSRNGEPSHVRLSFGLREASRAMRRR